MTPDGVPPPAPAASAPLAPGWGAAAMAAYLAQATPGDVLRGDAGRGGEGRAGEGQGGEGQGGGWWRTLFDGVAHLGDGRLGRVQDRLAAQVSEIGTAFRVPGERDERRWPLSALPLLIGEDEWSIIEAGVCQRATLLEALLEGIYGSAGEPGGALVADGSLPAAVVAGSRHFARSMIGMRVPGGHRLHVYAVDLGRGPDGEWRVLADHARAPVGAGYALENRLAAGRVMGALQARLNVRRVADFFSAFREGLAASCRRADPRIGLLTPGRYNPSYAEQAHLARYLGLLLVEGADLAVREGQLYVRTVAGLKRIDALWRRMDARFLDPLAFDSGSQIGVPGLMDAMASGAAVIANAPGAGVVESAAMAAFMPALARRLLGEELKLPNIATWWCGQPREAAIVRDQLDTLLIAPAFSYPPAGFADLRPQLGATMAPDARAAIVEAMTLRPQDYVGQEVVHLSTMPAVVGGQLVARPFSLRVFAARDGQGRWTVMPGGFARIADDADIRAAVMGDGALSADVCVVGSRAPEATTRLPTAVPIRRNPGTLPSRAADNLYWLGRYLERGEATLRLVRAALGGTLAAEAGASLRALTLDRLASLLVSSGACELDDDDDAEEGDEHGSVRDVPELAHEAFTGAGAASVRTLLETTRAIGEGIRERLSADVWRLLERAPPPPRAFDPAATLDRATALQQRFSALSGQAAENMGRNAGWRFHDLGRRLERAILLCRQLRAFAPDDAAADDLSVLLDLADSQISYRARYLTGLALVPVRDLVALDPSNPRSLAYQVARIGEHLAALPTLRDDGMAEEPQAIATEIAAMVATARAEALGADAVLRVENRLLACSDAIGRRFFLQGAETLRAGGMTLA